MKLRAIDDTLREGLSRLGLESAAVEPLAGDASHRRFFRVALAGEATVVAALYPPGGEDQVDHDARVQRWAREHGLPVPEALGVAGLVTVSEDLGSENLSAVAAREEETLQDQLLLALAAFQACPHAAAPNPPFDAALFRRELAAFEQYAAVVATRDATRFLDNLALRLATHTYRLLHRDFHLHNLFWKEGRVRAVDFQDMRGGPDTYDLASLLRERGASGAGLDEEQLLENAASRLAWAPGWHQRYFECAAQRGLKVVGTFRRLAAAGRQEYERWLPEASCRALEALRAVGAPDDVLSMLAGGPKTSGGV